jgi:hypothetical protein
VTLTRSGADVGAGVTSRRRLLICVDGCCVLSFQGTTNGGVMTRKLAISIGIMCVGILLTESSISHAATDAVPKLDTRLSCESHGRKAITHGNSNLSIAACKRSEDHAHQVLVQHWSQYTNNDKTNCHGMVTQGGPPSYVELHSCLESRKHAREIREAHNRHEPKKATRAKRTQHE